MEFTEGMNSMEVGITDGTENEGFVDLSSFTALIVDLLDAFCLEGLHSV